MKQFKRITGFMLAVLLVVGMLPTGVLADTVTYTGVDVRVYNTTIGEKISDAVPNIQFATDEMSEIHKPDSTVKVNGTWYHTVNTAAEIPAGKEAEYAAYTYGAYTVYARKVGADEVFAKDNQYLYVAELTPTAGTFSTTCLCGPISNVSASYDATKMTAHVRVTPTDRNTIQWIQFKSTNTGNITITESNPDWTYLYSVDSGEKMEDGWTGAPIGQYVVNNAECKVLNGTINVKNTPCITLYAVETSEWDAGRTSQVVAYGTYTIPMSDPAIEVDTLDFGEHITVTNIGTTTGGTYHWNIASASFNGWFTDKEGTTPATVEADAYAIFTVRSYGLFNPDIAAEDFTLKCSYETYSGIHLLPATASNERKVAFLIPSNRISFSLEVVGTGASMVFVGNEDNSSISMKPLDSGKYESKDIYISIEPGYYVKSLKVNGVEWDDQRNPFRGINARIYNDTPFEAGIPSFEPTCDTLITLEVAEADRITINYGDNRAVYTGRYADETEWHANGQYWVSETYGTVLCSSAAFISQDGMRNLRELNTKPDGTGESITADDFYFYYKPLAEYQNGVRDEITLYAIMECKAHVTYGAEDTAWEYYDEKPASCTEAGHVAHRYCPNCGQYQVKNPDGSYTVSNAKAIILEKLPHKHTVYTNTSETQHTVKCENCDDSYLENHKCENGTCVCGYREYVKGDMNEDGYVTDADAVYLLYYTIFAEDYPIYQPADFNGDGNVTDADAVYLLYYTIFPEDYPLN